ncbi:expressed unknown protein [Seminavis robusta]|uniref:Uncharacterized protein n=1 Tax=Seminavis robusta TaxID=568900 RepID=A0A9N8DY16_9STRA|nr:expressed unknown protein [Seminavis robusta]|eukprot:Sro358_g125820.1 n/a (217) ;mRNA; r:20715-21495
MILTLSKAYFSQPSVIVVFGRPGSGKTTIANRALDLLGGDDSDNNLHCIGLDLDVCVPQWMKDNFSKGIYPTLQQRQEFAKDCCAYVEQQFQQEQSKKYAAQRLAALISFSFVNTDLRDVFRSQFPHAVWILVDTSEEVSNLRIQQREGHFYGGKPDEPPPKEEKEETTEADNSEWNFAPVTFQHHILDGNTAIDDTAKKVADIVRETSATKATEE